MEGNFSATSWATYTEALAKADEVNTDPSASQSAVFDAKYALMVARNGLMDKADSCIDNGAYMQLEALIAQADVMFQNTALYTVKEGDAADAWANLVAALGYEYEDENGDTQNLYVNSAKAYVASDRVMSSTTDAEIASQVATLQDAINQFTCAITVVPDESVRITAPTLSRPNSSLMVLFLQPSLPAKTCLRSLKLLLPQATT